MRAFDAAYWSSILAAPGQLRVESLKSGMGACQEPKIVTANLGEIQQSFDCRNFQYRKFLELNQKGNSLRKKCHGTHENFVQFPFL